MIEFRMLNCDPLMDYIEGCKITQGVSLLDDTKEKPVDIYSELVKDIFFQRQHNDDKVVEWWLRQIVANHSTMRSIRFRMVAKAPKSVVMQIIRATKGHPQPEVQSSRPDWCGKERSGDPYEEIWFLQDHTCESFIEMCKQRLCARTEERTRQFMNSAVFKLIEKGGFFKALGLCCKPACGWLRGCPELKSCGKCEKLSDGFIEKS